MAVMKCGLAPPEIKAAGTEIDVADVPTVAPVAPKIDWMWTCVPILVEESRFMNPVPPETAVLIAFCHVVLRFKPEWPAIINCRRFRFPGGVVVAVSMISYGTCKCSR